MLLFQNFRPRFYRWIWIYLLLCRNFSWIEKSSIAILCHHRSSIGRDHESTLLDKSQEWSASFKMVSPCDLLLFLLHIIHKARGLPQFQAKDYKSCFFVCCFFSALDHDKCQFCWDGQSTLYWYFIWAFPIWPVFSMKTDEGLPGHLKIIFDPWKVKTLIWKRTDRR